MFRISGHLGEGFTLMRFRRFVAIGDSTTEGLDDPDDQGGYRGWADRLAGHLAVAQGGLEYANLAVRGRTTTEIRDEQVEAALALKADLVTVVAGMNDLLRPAFDAVTVASQVEEMFSLFTKAGASVLSFSLPDPTPNLPLRSQLQPRLRALNAELAAAAKRRGVIWVDIAGFPQNSDPRFWSDDRLHGNSRGHRRVAHALAWGLGLPGFDQSWRQPLPPAEPPPRFTAWRADVSWMHQHALPWLWRTARGRSAGHNRVPKRPVPEPVRAA
jgi:lysophospholipase L1-like esterase